MMVKELSTMTIASMKESGRITESMAREHTTDTMETSIQANGMIKKDKEKLTTRTELSMQVNGMMNREMDKELYTLQTDKYSTKESGTKTSMLARSNTKLFTIMHQLYSSKFTFYLFFLNRIQHCKFLIWLLDYSTFSYI